jgi:DNA-binding transcriptional ArsR family regulator
MTAMLDFPTLESVAGLFRALAEPTRLAILQVLQSRPHAVGELVERLGAKQANVSKQLNVLYAAGLLTRVREGNVVRYGIGEPMVFNLCELVCNKLKRDADRQSARLAGLTKSVRKRT